jgi:FMN phosphatase YigB (HAD superfamily)
MMARNPILLLDYGGVYAFEYERGAWDACFAQALGATVARFTSVNTGQLPAMFNSGTVSLKYYLEALAMRLGTKLVHDSASRLRAGLVQTTPMPSSAMRALVKDLRASGYSVGLVSDVPAFIAVTISRFGGYDGFDTVALSCDRGCSKRTGQLYAAALSDLAASPQDALAVDDRPYALEGASEVGISRRILVDGFSDAEELATAIRSHLIGTY